MCGSYGNQLEVQAYRDLFGLKVIPDLPERTLFRPTDVAPIITNQTGLELRLARWGFSQPPNAGKKLALFNARDDKLVSSPTWREAFRSRRCVVPMSEFHEFSGVKGAKVRHAFQPSHARAFMVAGLWQDGHFSLITTHANSTVSSYHDRMPVILKPRDVEVWLEPGVAVGELLWLCKPFLANRISVSSMF